MTEKTIPECDGCHKLACGCDPDFSIQRDWPSGLDLCGDCYQAHRARRARLAAGAEAMEDEYENVD